MRAAGAAGIVAAAALAVVPARGERIVSSLTNHQISINSSFTGLDIVLFGTVEQDEASRPRNTPYDLVVTVLGPPESLVTRRKERVLGIWVNTESRSFVEVPSYAAALFTRPLDRFVDTEVQRREQLGLRQLLLRQQIGPDIADVVRDDSFRVAFLRLKTARHLYVESPSGVTFLTPNLFRATIPLPAEVETGDYAVSVKLFADGAVVAQDTSAFEVLKVGFEQVVANLAQTHGFLYGLATAAMALMTGWFASVVFRRD